MLKEACVQAPEQGKSHRSLTIPFADIYDTGFPMPIRSLFAFPLKNFFGFDNSPCRNLLSKKITHHGQSAGGKNFCSEGMKFKTGKISLKRIERHCDQ
mmetsp:Transcript_5887/g.20798  ORF Transcript_5887/g.20798 Transcript_5887/m.20798 type:complete len:98 (+) Transcript_5887:1957-2250(+)